MKTSAAGKLAIEAREGVRLKAYVDSVGVLTIGCGHTSAAGPPHVVPGLVITHAECDAILARDLAAVEAMVNRVITAPMKQNEFDAFVSIAYNIGNNAFEHSSIVKAFNSGDHKGTSAAIMKWQKPPEIIGRRTSEQRQFLKG